MNENRPRINLGEKMILARIFINYFENAKIYTKKIDVLEKELKLVNRILSGNRNSYWLWFYDVKGAKEKIKTAIKEWKKIGTITGSV
jgi:hypothetical protein